MQDENDGEEVAAPVPAEFDSGSSELLLIQRLMEQPIAVTLAPTRQ